MHRKRRAWLLSFGVLLVLFLLWSWWTPIPFTALKIASLLAAGALGVVLFLCFKPAKWFVLAALAFLLVCAVWPSRVRGREALRASYLASLQSYRGTPYVWGCENARGIDCSGLMRRAMIDALIKQGWQEKNPALWRESARIWWRDCSASHMKSGYEGQIQPLFAARSLNALSTARLQPGDLAVTRSGVHVLAYVGVNTWIEADPNIANGGDKVIEVTAPSKNGWFGQPIVICRWRLLA